MTPPTKGLPPDYVAHVERYLSGHADHLKAWQMLLRYMTDMHQCRVSIDDLLQLASIEGVNAQTALLPVLIVLCDTTPPLVRREDVRFTPTSPIDDQIYHFNYHSLLQ